MNESFGHLLEITLRTSQRMESQVFEILQGPIKQIERTKQVCVFPSVIVVALVVFHTHSPIPTNHESNLRSSWPLDGSELRQTTGRGVGSDESICGCRGSLGKWPYTRADCVVWSLYELVQKVVRKYYRDSACLTDLVRCVVIHRTVRGTHTHTRAHTHIHTHTHTQSQLITISKE